MGSTATETGEVPVAHGGVGEPIKQTVAGSIGVNAPVAPMVNCDTSPLVLFATYAYLPIGSTMTETGPDPGKPDATVGVSIGFNAPPAPMVNCEMT